MDHGSRKEGRNGKGRVACLLAFCGNAGYGEGVLHMSGTDGFERLEFRFGSSGLGTLAVCLDMQAGRAGIMILGWDGMGFFMYCTKSSLSRARGIIMAQAQISILPFSDHSSVPLSFLHLVGNFSGALGKLEIGVREDRYLRDGGDRGRG